jgi:peptidyl-tRNA hydrolase
VGTGWSFTGPFFYIHGIYSQASTCYREEAGEAEATSVVALLPPRDTHGEFAMGKVMRSDVVKFKSWLGERVACPEASGHFEIWEYEPFCEVRDEWDDFGERKLVWQMKSSDYLCAGEIDPKAKNIARLLKAVKDEFKLVVAKDDEHMFYAVRLPR